MPDSSRTSTTSTQQIKARRHRLQAIAEPDSRLTNQSLDGSLRSEIAALEARRDDYKRETRQLSQRILQGEDGEQKVALDHAADVSKQLVQVADAIARARETARSGDALSSSLSMQSGSNEMRTVEITVVRGTPDGPVIFPASPTTTLAPGDVVQLVAAGSTADPAPQSTAAVNP